METLHVNLWAGPGTGKSTIAAEIFGKLKWAKIDCELINEYAKELVWEESQNKLGNQIYVFGKQLHKHYIINGKVKVAITDSPLPLGCIYDEGKTKHLKDLVLSEFNKMNNMNIYLIRTKEYNPNGRNQTYEEALVKDKEIEEFMNDNNIDYTVAFAKEDTAEILSKRIIDIVNFSNKD